MTEFRLTAATIKAVLCFIDPVNTPKIAYNRDDLAIPLINKLKEAIGDKDGSQPIQIIWTEEEEELLAQFTGICQNIVSILGVITGLPSRYFN